MHIRTNIFDTSSFAYYLHFPFSKSQLNIYSEKFFFILNSLSPTGITLFVFANIQVVNENSFRGSRNFHLFSQNGGFCIKKLIHAFITTFALN